MIYVIGKSSIEGLDELCQKLGAMRVRKFDGLNFWVSRQNLQLNPGDFVIPWGISIPEIDGMNIINPTGDATLSTEFGQLQRILSKGINTISAYKAHTRFVGARGYLPRKFGHTGGSDLINPPANPDYYTIQVNFKKEYVVHVFSNRTILAGEKVPIEGFCLRTIHGYPCRTCDPNAPSLPEGPGHGPHPWIRVPAYGWKVDYTIKPPGSVKAQAQAANTALESMFGVYTLGIPVGGEHPWVININKIPTLSPQVLHVYSKALSGFINHKMEALVKQQNDEPEVVGDAPF